MCWSRRSPTLLSVSERDDDQVTVLALAAGRGDSAALEAFIKATQRDVWRTVAFLGDPGQADDLTQETFLRALGALPRFSGRSSARTWLMTIARRVVIDQIRRNQARPRTGYGIDLDQVLDTRPSAARFEDIIEIRMLLDGLDTDRRHALMLTQVLGLSYAEAAEVCGCPVGTIRSRVARAREDLISAAHRDDQVG
ncbi:RNA polymerase sigma factor SigC [Mycobacterium pinniadriaticum]|uniref:RNA polymerase sigma factor SigC n=1 Tax=Mycobacterium pinniadriaticum TaxID=2994102 RepID=UPI003899073E